MSSKTTSSLRVGVQTITWGESIREHLPEICAFLAETGYHGVEVGVRHFDLSQPARYRELFAAHGLTPLAVHTGGTFWDQAQADQEMANMEKAIAFASEVGFACFVLSGNKDETPESMVTAAAAYERIGSHCRKAGLQFLYHNHDWEFRNDMATLKVLLEHSSVENVKLLPDVAWIHRAGLDPGQFLRDYAARIGYVHLKDRREDTFCELGAGTVPLEGVLDAVNAVGFPWVVVEQDTTTRTPEESLRESAAWLRNRKVL